MIDIKNNDGSWIKVETKAKVLTYTDSDNVWMKEIYNDKNLILSRNDSFGKWEKFTYKFDPVKKKNVLDVHTKGINK